MPQFEYNFTATQLDLITSSEDKTYLFPQTDYDYIRITIFDISSNFIGTYDSNDEEVITTLSNQGHKFIYTDNLNVDGSANDESKVFVKVNEILTDFGYSEGRYQIKFDFLRNTFDNITWSNQEEQNTFKDANVHFIATEISPSRKEIRLILRDDLEVNPYNLLPTSEQSIRNKLSESMAYETVTFVLGDPVIDPLISLGIADEMDWYISDLMFQGDNQNTSYDLGQYLDFWNNFEWVPELLGEEPEEEPEWVAYMRRKATFFAIDLDGDGKIDSEDLVKLLDLAGGGIWDENYNQNGHQLGEISTTVLPEEFREYKFDYVLSKPDIGVSVPIVNYRFDDLTNPGYTSLVLRFQVPLPNSVNILDTQNLVEINQELIDTQTERLYFYQSQSPIFTANGLNIDESVVYNTTEDTNLYESYNDLTESISDFGVVHHILSESENNLKTDFTNFDNHIFFGSAKKQLEGFKIKVQTIENHLNEISGTLHSYSGSVAIGGDSTYTINRREELFSKIDKEIANFSPYEHFLYFDGQQTTSGSAPGIGPSLVDENYALSNRQVTTGDETVTAAFTEKISKQDGFRGVYKINDSSNSYSAGDGYSNNMWPFMNKYRVEKPPFFNYSGSLYLSFLIKSEHTSSGGAKINFVPADFLNTYPTNTSKYKSIPTDAAQSDLHYNGSWEVNGNSKTLFFNNWLQEQITGSNWLRVMVATSQSYWSVTTTGNSNAIVDDVPDWNNSNCYEILTDNLKTGSIPIRTENEYYQNLATVVTGSGAPFKGSIMPSGELFPLYFGMKTATTSSFITDIKISKNNPENVLPFGQIVSTSSLQWTQWYDGMLSSASKYDGDNIHSLQNNLPSQYSGSQNLESFVGLMGQEFDLLRMYITNYSSLYNRGYQKTDSVPDNLLPVLADTLGWNIISPFTSSLQDYFGNALNTQDEYRKNELLNSTWRKSLNNLIYIYKTKGTRDSINALLNIYGYPNGVIEVEEGGTSNEEMNPSVITSESFALPAGLSAVAGNVAFNQSDADLYSFRFKGNDSESYDRRIQTDWFINGASPINAVEFIYKHVSSSNGAQEILLSSGSGDSGGENLWDFRVLQKGSGSKFSLRLNKSNYLTPTGSLGVTFTSMSTNFEHIKYGELRNVLLTREFNHISGTGTQNYKIYVGSQDKDKIDNYYTASLSVVADDANDADYNANRNWVGTGSRHKNSGSNLVIGRTLSGSLAEFRTWTTVISESKFKQHILNPFSVVGNNINSSRTDIVYHYKFNELTDNTSSLNGTIKINDSNPTNKKDFSVTLNYPKMFHSASSFWGKSDVTRNTIQLRVGGNTKNSNKISLKSIAGTKRDLSPVARSITTKYEQKSPAARNTSNKVSIVRSPQRFLNNFILNHFAGSNLLDKFGKPESLYSSSYGDLDTLRNDFFDSFNISFEINKFIDAQAGLLNSEMVTSVTEQLPARTHAEVGILLEPSLLERNKYEHKKMNLTYGAPGPENLKKEIFISSSVSVYEPISTYENPPTDIISLRESVVPTAINELSKNSNINPINNISLTSSYDAHKLASISTLSTITQSMFYESSKDINLSTLSTVTQSMFYESSKNVELSAISNITQSMTYESIKNASLSPINNITLLSSYIQPKTGSITYVNTQFLKDFTVGDENWGRDEANDVHFVQAAASGSGNRWHYENRYIFYQVGDMEIIDSSTRSKVTYWEHIPQRSDTDFTNPKNFKNREIRDKGKGYTYKSYIKVGNNIEGPQDGRPVGSTAYFVTSSDGDILYPVNHWIKLGRSSDCLYHALYGGTKNTGGKILQLREQEDYSKDAFYRVKVTGDNVLKVNRGKQKKNNNDTLGY